MLLQYLLENLTNVEVEGKTDKEIVKIEYNSKNITSGDVFVAISGYNEDGNAYINEAIENGATAIVSQEEIKDKLDYVTYIKVEDTRIALAQMAATYYGNPARKLKMIGVTGTKGKTTTSYMIRNIMLASGKKIGMIGTICNTYADVVEPSLRTSPESLELQALLARMVEAGMESGVLEVSSHALELNRVYGIRFVVGVYTNLSEDHLDFHETMENYLNAKAKLFEMSDFAIVNGDDIYAPRLMKKITTKYATYGLDNAVDLTATDIRINPSYVEFKMYVNKMLETVRINIPGRFTVYNALAAIGVCSLFGAQMDAILMALAELRVPGRNEVVDINKTFTVIIDYAHTPSSLEAILTSAKRYTKGRIICVFGCGGDRDVEKRKMMGEISGRLADFTVITSDNPRNEKPEDIIKEIESGIKETRGLYKAIENRRQAIKFAMRIAWKSDVIIIAGKGHETYQEVSNNKRVPFDDKEIVKKIAEEMPDKNIQ